MPDPIDSSHFLQIPNKEFIQKALAESNPADAASKINEAFIEIENWARRCFVDGYFNSETLEYEIIWTYLGPLVTQYSPEFYVPVNLVLTEVLYHLTTAATTTGPTLHVYKNTTSLGSVAMGTSDDGSDTYSTSFTADSDEVKFRISSIGDGTARDLVCIARFESS